MTATTPHTMTLPDGRVLFVAIPSHMTGRDRDGSLLLRPDAVRLLDRVRALAMKTPTAPSPAYLRTVREALGVTQAAFARRLGYSTITIKKWESGARKPGQQAVRQLQKLIDHATRKGVVLAA